MVSALTLLRTGDHPGDSGNWSYLLLADEVRRASAEPEDDLRELFGRMCFNAAVSNLDDHPRNHAMLARGRQWRLSPSFDLTPAVARKRRDLAMACGRFGRYANWTNLLSGHGRFLLKQAEAEAVFDRIAGTVRLRWYADVRRAGASGRHCEAIRAAFLYDGLFCGNPGLGARLGYEMYQRTVSQAWGPKQHCLNCSDVGCAYLSGGPVRLGVAHYLT